MPMLLIYQTRNKNKYLLGNHAVMNQVALCLEEMKNTKNTKERQKEDVETKFLSLHDLVRGSNKIFMEIHSLFLHQQQTWWNGWEICNVFGIRNNEMFQSFFVERSWKQWFLSKKSFCTRRFRKRKCFRISDHKLIDRKLV